MGLGQRARPRGGGDYEGRDARRRDARTENPRRAGGGGWGRRRAVRARDGTRTHRRVPATVVRPPRAFADGSAAREVRQRRAGRVVRGRAPLTDRGGRLGRDFTTRRARSRGSTRRPSRPRASREFDDGSPNRTRRFARVAPRVRACDEGTRDTRERIVSRANGRGLTRTARQ